LHLDPSDFSFKAVSTANGESPFIPPDSMGDVGPTQIFVHVNGRLKVFDKLGVLGALNSNNNNFWESVRAGQRVSDPEVRYDRLSGRWFLAIINLATVNNLILVAVSSGAEITGSSSFTFYSFPVSVGGSGEDANVCDYPSLGVDAQALYVGCNMFDTAGSYRHSTAYVIRKSSLLSGGPVVVTPFANITGGVIAGPYSPRGVDNDDAQATEGYFIGVDVALFSRLVIRRVLDPGGTPSLSGNINLMVPSTSLPLLQVAQGSTTSLDTLDDRLFMGAIHRNKITGVDSLWTAHHIAVDSTCVGATTGAGRRNGARWYEIADLGGTPSLVQAGTLCDQAAANPRGFIYPSVTGTGQGHMALGASFAAANSFIGATTASRSRDDSPGSLQAPVFVQPGLASYTVLGGGFNRWGDYSFTAVDPNDDMSVWTIQEYADTPASNWAVRVVQLIAPPPPTPSAPMPSVLCTSAGPVAVTVTGISAAGEEFFDPGPDPGGPGFASHLTASACPGVAVNSTAFVDPLHVTVSLDAASAIPGSCDLTIINPDGQGAIGVGILSIAAPPTEMNDSLLLADSGGTTTLSWADPPGEYNVYRGERVSGAPWTYNQTCLASHLAAATATDATVPPIGSVFIYQVTRANACGESVAGRDSTGAPIPNPAPCP